MSPLANRNFAQVLRAERQRLGLTQTQLAERIGTSQQNIAGMEKGLSLPKPALHDKMVDLFGSTSPVSNLPPTRDGALTIEVMARLVDKGTSKETLAHHAAAPEREQAARQAPNRRERNDAFRALLPDDLQANVEQMVLVGDIPYRVDYLSPKLCIEIKAPAHVTSVLHAARVGLQQLHLYGEVLRPAGRTPRLTLALVKGDMDLWSTPDAHPRGKRIVMEAGYMHIHALMVPALKDLADYIVRIEQGLDEPVVALAEEDDDY